VPLRCLGSFGQVADHDLLALRVRAARHHHSAEAEARAILTAGLSGEEVPTSVLLAADTGHDIDFDPERLGLIAFTPEL
jgi:plasmid stability protein